MKKNGDDKFYVQSVHRTLEILEEISKGKNSGKSVSELSKSLNLPVSTVYRLIQNLVARNYLYERDDGNYTLGLKLLELGSLVQKNLEIRSLARKTMESLNKETKETIYLAKLDKQDGSLIYIDKFESLRNVTLTAGIGTRNYLHSTANGKCLVAGFNDGEIKYLLAKKGMPPLTDKTITTVDAFLQEIAKVREEGYALDDLENEENVRCVAAPIYDYGKKIVASISISGVSTNMSLGHLQTTYKDLIKAAARDISLKLGFQY